LPNPQAVGPPLVDYSQLLIGYIRNYPHIWRPSTPFATRRCSTLAGDRDPHNTPKERHD